VNPKYPIYIVSKGRWSNNLTAKFLNEIKLDYSIIVGKEEYNNYADFIDPNKILILPQKYLDNYNTFDDLGDTKSKGPGAARNFAWEDSISKGHKYHWVMDDNIYWFGRMHNNFTAPVADGTILRCMEDFTLRYSNVLISGPNYAKFAKNTDKVPAFVINTRIYSCLFIKNDMPYRWRGRYNEDTDLCLRVLKDGLCTIQFNAFQQEKITTQTMQGGNTKEFYVNEGTMPKSQMIADMHPDVAKVVWKFNRWHHHVDYKRFKRNKLIKKKGLKIPKGINNYGMVLQYKVKPYPKRGGNAG